jgi:exopolysaccharide biosynthesis polyprenyl glycosylphosphotransferase
MGTKLVEAQRIEEGLGAPRQETSARTNRFANLLKLKTAGRVLSLAGDALALAVAHVAASQLLQHFLQVPSVALNPRNYVAFYLPFLLVVLFLFERNQRPDLRRPEKELELTVKGVSLAFLLLVCANFVVFKTGFSRFLMVSWYLLSVVGLLGVRFGLRSAYRALWKRGIARKNTLLVGSAAKLFELQSLLSIQRYGGYNLLGIALEGEGSPEDVESSGLPVLGSLDRWQEVAREHQAEQVVVLLEKRTPEAHRLVSDILKRCLTDGIDVQVYSDLFASREFNYELDEFSGFFNFFSAPRWSNRVQMVAKSVLDFLAGVVGSALTGALLPVIGLLIKLEDGGPIFYRSPYVGPDGGNRYYLKFRSMRVDADKVLENDAELRRQFDAQCKLKKDPRVTRIGRLLRKYSIDEFPSFFSILRGQISLVGPRTIMQMQKEKYGHDLPKLLSVKPGLTGYWQVMGRQLTTHDERVQMDMFYIDHWSIWLDLWITAKTFWKVVRAEGAY